MVNIYLPDRTPPDWDSTDRISIGWMGVITGYTRWSWIRADEASKITGATPRALRYWSDTALISYMSDAPHHLRRYMCPEIEAIRIIALGRPIATRLLRQIIAYELRISTPPTS